LVVRRALPATFGVRHHQIAFGKHHRWLVVAIPSTKGGWWLRKTLVLEKQICDMWLLVGSIDTILTNQSTRMRLITSFLLEKGNYLQLIENYSGFGQNSIKYVH
jgi:hypothetical protein